MAAEADAVVLVGGKGTRLRPLTLSALTAVGVDLVNAMMPGAFRFACATGHEPARDIPCAALSVTQ